ncbi:hypothetical protein VNO80_05136 [Phaseolus coccineus]|uniref:Uncharacterized protein n=1 Tax=Phaseolus coccineus TaxID=3886 RepID=A0AAN9NFQ5_PHACN
MNIEVPGLLNELSRTKTSAPFYLCPSKHVEEKAFPRPAIVEYNFWLAYSPIHWRSSSHCLSLKSTTVSCVSIYVCIYLVSMVC